MTKPLAVLVLLITSACAQDLKSVIQTPSAQPKPELTRDVIVDIRNKQIHGYQIALQVQQEKITSLEAQIKGMQLEHELNGLSADISASIDAVAKNLKLGPTLKINPYTLAVEPASTK
jgi:hypothetical protein